MLAVACVACAACGRPAASLELAPALVGKPVPPPAPPSSPPCKGLRTFEVLPSSVDASAVTLFPSPQGFELFGTTVERHDGGADFWTTYTAITPEGATRVQPTRILKHGARHMAAGDGGVFALPYVEDTPNGWRGHVAAFHADTRSIVWDVAIPTQGAGHGKIAIAWDAKARQWVVVAEELAPVPNGPAGNTYERLVSARIDAGGRWATRPTPFTTWPVTGHFSDWGHPMTMASDRVAIVWDSYQNGGDQTWKIYVTELSAAGTTHIPVATTAMHLGRGVVTSTAAGYVVVGSEPATSEHRARVFMTTVRSGVASGRHYLSSEDTDAQESVVASDGSRVAIAWDENRSSGDNSAPNRMQGSTVHIAVVDADGTISSVPGSTPQPYQRDSVESLTWTGCEFALVYSTGANPSSTQLVLFP